MVPVQESRFPSCGNAEIPGVEDIWWGYPQFNDRPGPLPRGGKWERLTISCISSACNLLDTDCPALIPEGPVVLLERVGTVLELFSASLFMMRLVIRILIPW